VRITLDEGLRGRIPDLKFFHDFVRAMFCHRRKFLRSELLSVVKGRLGKPEVDAILARLNFSATARAEELDVETMLGLCEAVRTYA
jgi:16S rRNA (adenine1518-N6/adenine1519-N6)-dimethyltransferase